MRIFVVAAVCSLLASLGFAADAPKTLVPPDSLAIDGVPAIPAELTEQVGRYTESRAAVFADWHPKRTEMLILTRFGDTNQVHLVAQPGGARTQLTFFPDRVDGATFDPSTATTSFSRAESVEMNSTRITATILGPAISRY